MRPTSSISSLPLIAFALAACGDAPVEPRSPSLPAEPLFAKEVFERCKPHLNVATTSRDESAPLPLLHLLAPDQPVTLVAEDGSATDGRFHGNILVWENAEACGTVGLRWTAVSSGQGGEPAEPRAGLANIVEHGSLDVHLEDGTVVGFEVIGEVCDTAESACAPARIDLLTIVPHELGDRQRGEDVRMTLRVETRGVAETFHAHGHLDYLKAVGELAAASAARKPSFVGYRPQFYISTGIGGSAEAGGPRVQAALTDLPSGTVGGTALVGAVRYSFDAFRLDCSGETPVVHLMGSSRPLSGDPSPAHIIVRVPDPEDLPPDTRASGSGHGHSDEIEILSWSWGRTDAAGREGEYKYIPVRRYDVPGCKEEGAAS